MTLSADAVALVLAASSFLVALGSFAYTTSKERRAWTDWEAWSAQERQRITTLGEEAMKGQLKAANATIQAQLNEAASQNRKAQAQFAKAMQLARGPAQNQVQALDMAEAPEGGFFPLPSQLGINPEEASVQARQQAQGIDRDVHGWARNGRG